MFGRDGRYGRSTGIARSDHDSGTKESMVKSLKSLISGDDISSSRYIVSLIVSSERSSDGHAYLLLEGCHQGEYKIFRADLLLDNRRRKKYLDSVTSDSSYHTHGSIMGKLWNSCQTIGQKILIKLEQFENDDKTIDDEFPFLQNSERYQYNSWPLTAQQAEQFIEILIRDLNEDRIRYFAPGHSSSSSVIESSVDVRYENCITWCTEILSPVLGYKVDGSATKFIKKPAEIIALIRENNLRTQQMQPEEQSNEVTSSSPLMLV